MLSFKQYILEFFTLLENRIDFLKNQFAGKLTTDHDPYGVHKDHENIIDHFANNADPTKNKAHTQWILRQYQQQRIRQEDHPRIKDTLSNFERYKNKLSNKDINSYKSLSDLEDALEPHIGTEEPLSKRQETKKIKEEGSDLLLSKNGVSARRLKTKEAACNYGKGTKWCTAAEKNNMADTYLKQGNLYYIEGRNHKGEIKKFQYHPHSGQFMDEKDKPIDIPSFVKRNPELTEHDEFKHLKVHDKNATKEDLDNAISHSSPIVRITALKHPNATSDHITKGLNAEKSTVREVAIRHPNATPDHITKSLDDSDFMVRSAAAKHPNATPDHITKALNDEDILVRSAAASNPNATIAHIRKALSDKSSEVRNRAVSNPNATSAHITKALNDSSPGIRMSAASNPNATAEHLTKALNDGDSEVRRTAINHPNATPDHITKALNDEDYNVRAAAARNPNLTADHLKQALNHEDPDIRNIAMHHPNAKKFGLI